MNKLTTIEAPQADPQSEVDPHGVGIDHVGISRVRYPILISGWEASQGRQEIKEGTFSLKVSLAADKRGIHMSRLLESINHWEKPLSPASMPDLLTEIRAQQGSATAELTCAFMWFIQRPAPQTERPAWQGIETTYHGRQNAQGKSVTGYTLRIPVTTLCPCSREISDYGAHSQRGWVQVKIEWRDGQEIVSPQEVFDKLQHAGSAPIYPLLKRADERHVTMLAYEQPCFVEDTIRRAALYLKEDNRIPNFQLDICNEESIHTHDAIASLSYTR
jgi:GTP cyclohydrolase I